MEISQGHSCVISLFPATFWAQITVKTAFLRVTWQFCFTQLETDFCTATKKWEGNVSGSNHRGLLSLSLSYLSSISLSRHMSLCLRSLSGLWLCVCNVLHELVPTPETSHTEERLCWVHKCLCGREGSAFTGHLLTCFSIASHPLEMIYQLERLYSLSISLPPILQE